MRGEGLPLFLGCKFKAANAHAVFHAMFCQKQLRVPRKTKELWHSGQQACDVVCSHLTPRPDDVNRAALCQDCSFPQLQSLQRQVAPLLEGGVTQVSQLSQEKPSSLTQNMRTSSKLTGWSGKNGKREEFSLFAPPSVCAHFSGWSWQEALFAM